ncbi:hypothetical protein, partial [Glycomyces tenuis]
RLVQLSMTKPGAVTAAQAVLWVFVALAAAGEIYSAVHLATAPSPVGVLGLVGAVAVTALSVLFPVNLGRGRRWAWVWPVIGSSIGLPVAVLMIVAALENLEHTLPTLVIGAVQAGVYGSLLRLLCAGPTRRWILVNRIRRGEVEVETAPHGTVPPGSVAVAESERPAKRPVSVPLLQIAVGLIALTSLTTVNASITEARGDLASSTEQPEPTLAELLLGEHLPELVLSLVVVLALALPAAVSIVGLRRGRAWARVHTAIWAGVAAAGSLLWVQLSLDWLNDADLTGHEAVLAPALVAMSFAAAAACVLAIAAFCMAFSRGVRRWTPGPRYLAAPAGPAPGP